MPNYKGISWGLLWRGNRGECCALLLGDSSDACCLSSMCHPHMHTGMALSSPWRYECIYIKYAALSHIFFQANSRASRFLEYSPIRGKQLYICKILLCCFMQTLPAFVVFFKRPLERASVFTNVLAVARDAYTHAGSQWEAGIAHLIWPQCESHVREDSCASSWTYQPLAPPPVLLDKPLTHSYEW